jgi:hypothetical protein
MNKLQATIAVAFVALSASAFAQVATRDTDSDAARQQRMDAAYAAHRDAPADRDDDGARRNVQVASNTVREDTHRLGHAIHNGVRATGHAVHQGVRATGHAVHKGVKATGHAIHRGVDKVTGK